MENDILKIQLASAADLVNTWMRELGMDNHQVENPYSSCNLKNAIDKIWSKTSKESADLKSQLSLSELRSPERFDELDSNW